MTTIDDLKNDLEQIKARNKRVETDKAWETSWARKFFIAIATYLLIVVFFIFAKLPDPFRNAIVPALAFIISTLTVPLIKEFWLKNIYKK